METITLHEGTQPNSPPETKANVRVSLTGKVSRKLCLLAGGGYAWPAPRERSCALGDVGVTGN